MTGDEQQARRRASAHAAAVHADAQRKAREAQQRKARELVAGFVRDVTARGIAAVPLTARGYGGRHRYRTGLRGWYLKPDRSIAVGTDGEFYILSVPDSALARVRGARLAPTPPPLTVGEGARDGETLPLADLLRLRLDRPLD
ncbi:hypothetical protein Athai_10790 [Actinocatenispora thailandica]|uniref:Uncharacterized protein n=1 Tax=Actinocatenispora thailandica TaxID=227318 RepID=A0A7R7HVH2_9ACTN|nr:hypothetical protein [Actinocatenispora thailandica]BCJ33576.1 hypothetical protein Athai_10790 [Actinocatenispora thailandica]